MYYNWLGVASPAVTAMIWLSLVLTLASSADYLRRLRGLINEPPAPT